MTLIFICLNSVLMISDIISVLFPGRHETPGLASVEVLWMYKSCNTDINECDVN